MLKSIALIVLIALVAAVVVVLLIASTRPKTFEYRRSAIVNAPPERVFALIDDLRRFNRWNPYARKDPAMHSQFSGPAAGPGARLDFAGNKQVGRGSLEITASQAPQRVEMELHMLEPFAARNRAEFSLVPTGTGGTQVTWAMRGDAPLISRVVGVFIDMDRMIGSDFEAGLAHLKAEAERPAASSV
jgi:uncharacterized protein YndB with AHSA1/START domain